MPIEKEIFSLIVAVIAVHSLASWWLLVLVRNDIEIRTELFGSFKTLVLGPKAIRLILIRIRNSINNPVPCGD